MSVIIAAVMASARAPQNSGANRKVAQQQFDQWKKDLNNWGLASDHPQYVSPSEVVGAVHDFALVSLGIYLIDNWDLEALSEAAAARKRWEFLLTAAPPPIKRRHAITNESDRDVDDVRGAVTPHSF